MLPVVKNLLYITLIDGVRKGYQRSCILLTVTPQHSRVRSRRESNNGIHARWLGEVEWRYLDNWNTITIQYLYIQYNTIQYLDNLECSNRMLVPELDLIIARSWNRQNDVTVTLNIARKKWKFQKERSLRVQTSCKDFDQIGIQQPDACTSAELKFKLWRGITRNSRVEFHSSLRGRYPPWTSKGSSTFVKNLRNVI